jgi:SPP1 family predicted phage head-tail adaptor
MAHRLPTKIESGDLRHRIQIVKPSGSQDAMGGVSPDPSQWSVVRTCWASIEAWTGSQALAAGQFTSVTSHWIVMRHPVTVPITAGMYVWWNTRTFLIEAVLNPTETTKLLVLVVTEINDSAQLTATPVAP